MSIHSRNHFFLRRVNKWNVHIQNIYLQILKSKHLTKSNWGKIIIHVILNLYDFLQFTGRVLGSESFQNYDPLYKHNVFGKMARNSLWCHQTNLCTYNLPGVNVTGFSMTGFYDETKINIYFYGNKPIEVGLALTERCRKVPHLH